MSQNLELKYGRQKISLPLPDRTDIFQIHEPDKKITPSLFATRLREELERLNPDLSDIAIVVGDKTRLCGYPEYLPVLLDTLENFGADPDRMTLFIAYGTHAPQTEKECLEAYGGVYQNVRFVHHDCADDKCFVNSGQTSRGTSVLIRHDIVETGFLITFGAVSHHYFAGYGGGRKLIFPGLGHKASIYQNHGLFLDQKRQTLSPCCQSGILDKNPLAEDLAEFEAFRPADLAIHGILDSRGQVCDLLPGAGTDHFRNACAEHGKHCEVSVTGDYDLVIASCGGYPKDINFIQSHKAIEHASKFVRNDGMLIILAECRDGVGSKTFLPWFEMGGWKNAFDRLAQNYEGNGGTALSMMSKLNRIRILMVTQLSDSFCKTIGIEKISMDQAKLLVKQSTDSVAAIPNAGLVVKTAG
ncbi:MAG: nickel-dependent lactate racemase [Desulfobacterales bacterium]|nr:nickel-dependent lactate racemase [Desulfobacterales bacterium]